MENIEDRTEELPTPPGSKEPTPGDDDPTVPGKHTEPVGERVQEYPGEGVRVHYPTDPATASGSASDSERTGRLGFDESSGDEGI
jgi:hypothetical protein